jgi:hypothetical protein
MRGSVERALIRVWAGRPFGRVGDGRVGIVDDGCGDVGTSVLSAHCDHAPQTRGSAEVGADYVKGGAIPAGRGETTHSGIGT